MNKAILFLSVVILFTIQACGDDNSQDFGTIYKGHLCNNDESIIIDSEGSKFFCDFMWTKGKKRWNYNANGDEKIESSAEVNEPWCLIPYDSTTSYKFSFTTVEGERHYACRDKYESFYKIGEIQEEIETNIYYGEQKRIMNCTLLESNKSVKVSAIDENLSLVSTLLPDFMNNRLYYVIEENGLYTIKGHMNFKMVKTIELDVIIANFINRGGQNGTKPIENKKVDTIKQYVKDYMAKAGYKLSVSYTEVEFPSRYDNTNFPGRFDIIYPPDGIIAIPQEAIQFRRFIVDNNYDFDYILGVTPINSKSSGTSAEAYYDLDDAVFLTHNDFFNYDSKKKARQLSALLYSKILKKDPLSYKQERKWLSCYSSSPELDVNQPSADWEQGRSSSPLSKPSPEFALFMQGFEEVSQIAK